MLYQALDALKSFKYRKFSFFKIRITIILFLFFNLTQKLWGEIAVFSELKKIEDRFSVRTTRAQFTCSSLRGQKETIRGQITSFVLNKDKKWTTRCPITIFFKYGQNEAFWPRNPSE